MAKRLIGSGTTGTDGSVSIPYNGTGAGLVNLSVETEIDGSIVSVPLSVWDTLFYDDGVTDPKTANWQNYSNRLTISVDENGTTIAHEGSSGTGYYFTDNFEVSYSLPVVIEFDCVSYSNYNSCGLDFVNGSTDNNKTMNALGIQQGDHVKIVYDGATISTYRNGSTTPITNSLSISGSIKLGFYVGSGHSFKFKNFKLYKG